MGALNLPSAADVERLTRRLRSVSQRLEGIEDGVDRLDDRLATLGRRPGCRTSSRPSASAWPRSRRARAPGQGRARRRGGAQSDRA